MDIHIGRGTEVAVLVTAFVGQDVSVLGEVARPGVYPFTLHHRLFDMISAASGLGPTAGGVVNIYHRGDPNTPHPVPLDPNGAEFDVWEPRKHLGTDVDSRLHGAPSWFETMTTDVD